MFAKKGDFNVIRKYDKYGKKINKQDTSMQKFYSLEDKEKDAKNAEKSGSED